jgi:hypothetical protein
MPYITHVMYGTIKNTLISLYRRVGTRKLPKSKAHEKAINQPAHSIQRKIRSERILQMSYFRDHEKTRDQIEGRPLPQSAHSIQRKEKMQIKFYQSHNTVSCNLLLVILL